MASRRSCSVSWTVAPVAIQPGKKLRTASLAEREIDHHHITAFGLHDRLSHYDNGYVACPSGMVQSSSSKTSEVSMERSSGSQAE
jgi:hypothetical protein